MKGLLVAAALLLSLASAATAQEKQHAAKSRTVPPQHEAWERKLGEAFKNKDKATLSALLDGGFRRFEEGLSTFGDKKTEVNAVDEFELISYTLCDFTIKSIGPNAALVTYIATVRGKIRRRNLKGEEPSSERCGFVPEMNGKISMCKRRI